MRNRPRLYQPPDSLYYAHFAVSTGGIGGGVVTAIVMGILLFITLAVVTGAVVVLLTVIYIKRSKTKQLQRMQLDIMAV